MKYVNNSVYCGTSEGNMVVVSLDKMNIAKVESEKNFLLKSNGIDIKDLPYVYLCGQNGCSIADIEKGESYQWKSTNLNDIKISLINLPEFITVGDSNTKQLQIWDKREKSSVCCYNDKKSSGYKSLIVNENYYICGTNEGNIMKFDSRNMKESIPTNITLNFSTSIFYLSFYSFISL